MSATEKNTLADQLASLRLQRDEPKPASGRGLMWGVGALVAVGVLGGAGYVVSTQLNVKTATTAPVLLVQPGQQAPLFVATGTVNAPVTATLSPRTSGRLGKLLVQEGDEVKPEQAVALLDPTDMRLQLTQAKADVGVAEARVADAAVKVHSCEVRLARASKLAKNGAGTESAVEDAQLDLDAAKTALQVSQGDMGVSRARLSTAEQNYADMTLRAPFHGVVLRTLAQPGDFVAAAASSGVVRLANLDDLEIDAEVAEVNLGKVSVNMPVDVRLDAQPGQGLLGHVFSVRPNVDPAKATAIAKVRLERNAPLQGALYPGMNGRVNFLAQAPDAAAMQKAAQLEVPAGAVLHDGDHDVVLVVDTEGLLKSVPVVTAGTDADRVVLKAGPPAGATVVSTPEGLKSGDHIRVNSN